jgi:hypothetical protein
MGGPVNQPNLDVKDVLSVTVGFHKWCSPGTGIVEPVLETIEGTDQVAPRPNQIKRRSAIR